MELYFDSMLEGLEEINETAGDLNGVELTPEIESETAADALNDSPDLPEELTLEGEEIEALEAIASKRESDVSFLGARKDGWCTRSICQGEYSSFSCNGCTGKTSDHRTKGE